MAHFPRTRLAIASPTVQWALDRLGLVPAAISKPDDPEDMVNAIVRAESAAQATPSTKPRPSQPSTVVAHHQSGD
jgi:hypothetical protein